MLRILLAEDNPGDILLVQQALKAHKVEHELDRVHDGAEALAYISRIGSVEHPCPDLVLLDLNLPKVEGSEVLAAFRKHPACEQTPVIVVSSSDAKKDRARMSELNVARYFRKPSDFDEF